MFCRRLCLRSWLSSRPELGQPCFAMNDRRSFRRTSGPVPDAQTTSSAVRSAGRRLHFFSPWRGSLTDVVQDPICFPFQTTTAAQAPTEDLVPRRKFERENRKDPARNPATRLPYSLTLTLTHCLNLILDVNPNPYPNPQPKP